VDVCDVVMYFTVPLQCAMFVRSSSATMATASLAAMFAMVIVSVQMEATNDTVVSIHDYFAVVVQSVCNPVTNVRFTFILTRRIYLRKHCSGRM